MTTRAKSRLLSQIALIALVAVSSSACRMLSREVACRRDRDCPRDAGMSFCTSFDADAGLCTDDEAFRGDLPEEDAGEPDQADAGLGDAGVSPPDGTD